MENEKSNKILNQIEELREELRGTELEGSISDEFEFKVPIKYDISLLNSNINCIKSQINSFANIIDILIDINREKMDNDMNFKVNFYRNLINILNNG